MQTKKLFLFTSILSSVIITNEFDFEKITDRNFPEIYKFIVVFGQQDSFVFIRVIYMTYKLNLRGMTAFQQLTKNQNIVPLKN